jgi:hypothetical protein
MKIRASLLAGLSSVLLVSLSIAACGDDDSGSNGAPTGGAAGSGGTDGAAGDQSTGGAADGGTGGGPDGGAGGGAGGTPVAHNEPPEPGPISAPDGTGTTVFAIQRLFVGGTDPDGTPNATNGWKQYGYDIDGKVSTAESTDLCKPRNGAAAKTVYPDGIDGTDNSFGKNILPINLGISSNYEQDLNDKIAAGTFTMLFALDKLGAADAYNPLIARAYEGAPLGGTPKFDGTDVWPVTAESLTNAGDITSAKALFDESYLVENTFVSRPVGTLVIPNLLFGSDPITIHEAVVTMKLDAEHENATEGVISGVLDTAEVTAQLRTAAGRFDVSLCEGATIDSIIAQFEQASDIMKDGTQDPTKTCDGISIGLGFTATVVELGTVADPVTPPLDPCAP